MLTPKEYAIKRRRELGRERQKKLRSRRYEEAKREKPAPEDTKS